MTIARARFEIPARFKTDPILNNYLTQTMENNARSVVRRVQAEMQFILFSHRRTIRKDPCCLKVLDQRTDYVNRSSKIEVKECVWWTALAGRVKENNDKKDASVSRTALSTVQRFRRRIFVGKLSASALKPLRVWHVNKKKRENAAVSDFVDKSLVKSVGRV